MKLRSIFFAIPLLVFSPSIDAQGPGKQIKRDLTAGEIEAVKRGEIIRNCEREEGTQAVARGVGLINAPVEVVWEVLADLEYYDEIMPQTTASVLLDEATKDKAVKLDGAAADEVEKLFADNKPGFVLRDPEDPSRFTVYSYQRNNFPWPASDRWFLLRIEHDTSTYTQSWVYLAGNAKNDFGTWRLEPFGENQTLGWLEIHVDLGIAATGPFMKYALSLTMPDTYEAFRKGSIERMVLMGPVNEDKSTPQGGKK